MLRTNDKEYTGSFQNDEFHGEGTLKFTLNLDDNTEPTNAIYKGKFSKGKFNGKGTLTLENGDTYEGDFFDNVKRGIGKEMYSNGTIYRGALCYIIKLKKNHPSNPLLKKIFFFLI